MMWRHAVIGIGLVAATWMVFLPVAGFDFVNFDDPSYVTDNAYVPSGLSLENTIWAFQTTFLSNWHPLTWLSLMLDAELFGTDPRYFHLSNLVLHTFNVLLLYAVLWHMTRAIWCSACVAALFAIHPLHVESVAWIAERKDVLSTLFGLAAIGAYSQYTTSRRWSWYGIAWLAFFASLLAKQMLVTLPFLLLLLDVWPLGRTPLIGMAAPAGEASRKIETVSWGRLLLEKIPFLALSVILSAVVYATQSTGGSVRSLTSFPFGTRLSNALTAYVLYLKQTVWPVDLAVLYPHPGEFALSEVAIAVALLAIATGAVLWLLQRQPHLSVGWFWYLGTLVPVIGLVQIGDQQMADRYTYFPLIGVFIAVTWLAAAVASRSPWLRAAMVVCAMLAVAASGTLARAQVQVWQNSVTLFTHAIAVTGENPVAHYNLGVGYEQSERFDEAARHYRLTLDIAPDYLPAHHSLGNVRFSQKQYEQAIGHYRRALELDPLYGDAFNNLGNCFRELGRPEEAIAQFREALRVESHHSAAHGNLATLLYAQGQVDEALIHFREAARLAPGNPAAHSNLATALRERGEYEDAIEHYRQALRIDPDNRDAADGLALTYVHSATAMATAGELFDASGRLYQALELNPDSWLARYNLSRVLQLQNQPQQAEAELREVLRLNPNLAEAHNDLGALLLRRGQKAAAISHFREALRLKPDFTAARDNLKRANGQEP